MRLSRIVALTLLAASLPVSAQDLNMGGISNSWSSTQMLLNSEKDAWAAPECVKGVRWSVECDAPRPRDRKDSATTQKADPSFRYTPSLDLRRRNFARFAERTRASNPGGGKEMQSFLSTDLIAVMTPVLLSNYGLRTDDVADATTVYALEAWEAVNPGARPPTREQALVVRGQMARALAADPALASADDASRQEKAEAMLIQAAMIGSAVAELRRKSDDRGMEVLRGAVASGSRATLGIDLRGMTLTSAGLRNP